MSTRTEDMKLQTGSPQVARTSTCVHWPINIPAAVGCLTGIAIGIISAAMIAVIGQLVLRGELSVESGDWNKARVWLILEDENRGLGISIAQRLMSDAEKSEACVETRHGFLLWRRDGTARSGKSLECYERAKSEFWEVPLGKRLLKFLAARSGRVRSPESANTSPAALLISQASYSEPLGV